MEPVQKSYQKSNQSKFIQSANVVCIDSMATVTDAAKLMRENHIGDVVVVDKRNGKMIPVGIITDRDITIETCAQDVPTDKILVGDIMTKPVDVAHETDDVFALVNKMKNHGIGRLPVVDKSGSLTGFVSAQDIFKTLTKTLDDLASLTDLQHKKERETRH